MIKIRRNIKTEKILLLRIKKEEKLNPEKLEQEIQDELNIGLEEFKQLLQLKLNILHKELENLQQGIWQEAVQQFLNYTIPNDSLLQAASAVIFAQNGEDKIAEQNLNRAIELSDNFPGDRIEVLQMGEFIATTVSTGGNSQLGNSIKNRIAPLLTDAKIAAYDEVDKYLQGCMKELENCHEKELREWEAGAFRAGMVKEMWEIPTRDLAWLHGRFAYLIGIQLEDNKVRQRDRLRFLSEYVRNAKEEHHSELRKLETAFKKRLGIKVDSFDSMSSSKPSGKNIWIIIIAVGLIFYMSKLALKFFTGSYFIS